MCETKYFTEVWLKYVRMIENSSFYQATKVKRPEDVYDMMLELKVGAGFANTYSKVADYFEFENFNFRKADKIYRQGLDFI